MEGRFESQISYVSWFRIRTMRKKAASTVIVLLLLGLLIPGCTQKKDLRVELGNDNEYWKFLVAQGVRDLEYAKATTLVYIITAEKTGENPVDVLTAWRKEVEGKGLGEVVDFLMEKGMTREEAVLVADPLLSFDSDWEEFMYFTTATDDYVRSRIASAGIPARTVDVKQTYMTPETGGPTPGGPPPAGH
jgi:hypothetical protein